MPVGPPERCLLFGWHLGAKPRGDGAAPASGSWPPRPRPQVAAGRSAGDQKPAAGAVALLAGRCGPGRSRRAGGAGDREELKDKAGEWGERRALHAHFSAAQPTEGTRVAAPRSRRQARGTHEARTVPLALRRGSEKTPAQGAPLRPRRRPSLPRRLPAAREAQTSLSGRRWLVRGTKETWAGPGSGVRGSRVGAGSGVGARTPRARGDTKAPFQERAAPGRPPAGRAIRGCPGGRRTDGRRGLGRRGARRARAGRAGRRPGARAGGGGGGGGERGRAGGATSRLL